MRVLNNKNSLIVSDKKVIVDIYDELFLYRFDEIRKIAILTTARRLVNQTVFLVFEMIDEIYLIGLTHPDFDQVLLTDLKQICEVDNNLVIQAMQCTEDRQFVLYER